MPAGGLIGLDSYTGGYLLFNIFFIFYLLYSTKNKKIQVLLISLLCFILLSPIFFNFEFLKGAISFSSLLKNPMLILGSARAATIGIFSGMFLMLLLCLKNCKQKVVSLFSKITLSVFLGTIFLTLITLIVFNNYGIDKWFSKETGGFRTIYWHQAIEGFKEQPFLGWGPGNFGIVNEKYYDPAVLSINGGGEKISNKPHNVLLEILVCTGILGLITFFSIYFSVLFALWKSKNIDRTIKGVFFGLFLAFFLHDFVFFDYTLSYLMFAFSLAIVVLLHNIPENIYLPNDKKIISIKKWKVIVFSLLCVLFLIVSVRFFVILPIKKNKNYINILSLDPSSRMYLYEKNRDSSYFGGSDDEILVSGLLYVQYEPNIDEIKKEKNKEPYIGDLDHIILNVEDSFKGENETSRGIYSISDLYRLHYDITGYDPIILKKMKENGLKAVTYYPNDPRSYFIYSTPFIYEKNYKEAINILQNAINLNPHIVSLQKDMISAARLMGDKTIIEEKIKQAETNIPGVQFR